MALAKVAILGATGPTGRALAAELRRRLVMHRLVARRIAGLPAERTAG